MQKNAVANLARFAKCREMYRISHIVEFGLKIERGTGFFRDGLLDYPQNLVQTFISSVLRILHSLFWNFWFSSVFWHFFGENLARFWKMPKISPKSARKRMKIEIFKKAYIRSSVLMRWRSGPNLGVIQSAISSEKTFPLLNFKAKFYNMGNPIHFATFRERCRIRVITKFQHGKLFKFRKKFLNPCIPNFNICKIEQNLRPNPGPPLSP